MKNSLPQIAITSLNYDSIIEHIGSTFERLPDSRTGKNIVYSMKDATLGAFSVFFTQSPSFLDFQRNMELTKGKSNANSLFQMIDIPTDNHIRNLLDPVPPTNIFSCFSNINNNLYDSGYFESYRSINNTLLLPMDGTQFFSSDKINCKNCTVKELKNGKVNYSHTAITPVITATNANIVFPLEPEFITPQDGHKKQDCENAAAKRWLSTFGPHYSPWGVTILGDDLYCKQPLCEAIRAENFNFILVCKPDSHKTLYKYIENQEDLGKIETIKTKERCGKKKLFHTYRFSNNVPLRAGEDAMPVNWCELTTRDANDKIVFRNAFATDHTITRRNVQEIIDAGRARWKIENENNNTLKTKGYNLAHNFGHGKKHLATILVALNLLAFLVHTVLDLTDNSYRLIRQKLATRKNFFNDLRALTRYIHFSNWKSLLLFMMQGLEIVEPDTS